MNRAIIALAVLVGCAETDTTETTDNNTTETTETINTETPIADGANITEATNDENTPAEKTTTTTPSGESAVSSD